MQNRTQNQKTTAKAWWRQRDEEVIRILKVHPCTIAQLLPYWIFPSYKVAQRRLARLENRRKIKTVGFFYNQSETGGRPQKVYCGYHVKPSLVRHEVLLSEYLLHLREAPIYRGKDVDPEIRPDATMIIGNDTYHIEMDTGTESYAEVQKRLDHYLHCDDTVLFITTTWERVWKVQSMTEVDLLATTMEYVFADPLDEVWQDAKGRNRSVP